MKERAKKLPKLKKRLLTTRQLRLNNFKTGQDSELLAQTYLVTHGYSIVSTNVRIRNNEVDIIAKDTTTADLVFIEVKSRYTAQYGDPTQAVNLHKLKSMQSVASYYCKTIAYQGDYRFDIITVIKGSVAHFQNVTWNRR